MIISTGNPFKLGYNRAKGKKKNQNFLKNRKKKLEHKMIIKIYDNLFVCCGTFVFLRKTICSLVVSIFPFLFLFFLL